MHWEETVLKSQDIKWEAPKITNRKDGKLDFYLRLPLTNLFRMQAKISFMKGMLNMTNFMVEKQNSGELINEQDLERLFNDSGLPEISERLKRQAAESE